MKVHVSESPKYPLVFSYLEVEVQCHPVVPDLDNLIASREQVTSSLPYGQRSAPPTVDVGHL